MFVSLLILHSMPDSVSNFIFNLFPEFVLDFVFDLMFILFSVWYICLRPSGFGYPYYRRYILSVLYFATDAGIKARGHCRLVKSVTDHADGVLEVRADMSSLDNDWGDAPDHQHLLQWTKQSHELFAQLIKQNFETIIGDIVDDLDKAIEVHFNTLHVMNIFEKTEAGMMEDVMTDYYVSMEAHFHALKDIKCLSIDQSVLHNIRSDFVESSQLHRKWLQHIIDSNKCQETMNDVYKRRIHTRIFKYFDEAVQTHEKDLCEIMHLHEICDRAETKFGAN
ncbi:hypothetical protein FAVG1_08523 [Fusarium avenaceum]|nr:hypothetical protein FAVG1_08523 [Fusarium avenaceum]